ncbi:MAG: type II toxin-antitoxin system RelE/ParE family toxin [Planctomycetes bacterium]|nr:type II toxin-antitoxin system RelE/ParE family toxin [Planctomycetota bacterium]
MVKIIWSPQSLADLEQIAEYIARASPFYASSFVEKIIESVEILATFPRLGRKVPESEDPNVREIFYKKYRIIYQHSINRIEILTIFHSSRLLRL